MARVSRETAADNARRALRLKRSKAGAGKGLYLRAIEEGLERWDLTVEGAGGKKRVRHLQIPTTATNDAFRLEVERVRREIADAERIANTCTDLADWIDKYVQERGLSVNGEKTFRCAVRGFGLDAEENRRRVSELKASGCYKQSSLRTKLKHVKALFAYMAAKGVPIENPVGEGKIADGAPRTRIPTPAETAMLLQSVDATGDLLDRLYVRLLMATGARSSTMEMVRPCDLDEYQRLQLYNVKQRRKYGIRIPITDGETLRLWGIVTKDAAPDRPIFSHVHHDRLLRRMHALFPRNADGETLSPHSLRHAKSTAMARAGVPVKTAACILDASVAVMVRHYVTVQQAEVDEVFARLG